MILIYFKNIIIKKNKTKKNGFGKISKFKWFDFLFVLIIIFTFKNILKNYNYKLNKNYLKLQNNIKINFLNKLKNKIKLAIYIDKIKRGGDAKLTSLFLKYFNDFKVFDIYLSTLEIKEKEDFIVPLIIKRIFLKNNKIYNLIRQLKKKKIRILIYQYPKSTEINLLNKISYFKTIFYRHSSLFYFIYYNFFSFQNIYKEYFRSKYIISLIPLENDYIFKKWGFNSILMDNFMTHEYKSIKPSNLSSKIIIMLGRAYDKYKRFHLGIQAMEYIIKGIPDCKMKIISFLNNTQFLRDLSSNLYLKDSVEFIGFTSQPEKYFLDASLHIFPSLTEAFSLALGEIKIYGIPSILLGLDYITLSKGGTIIIYDETPENLAIEALKIMKNEKYRKKLGKEARLSIKKFNNKLLIKKWMKVILSIYNNDIYYEQLKNKANKINKRHALKILKNQFYLLKKRCFFYKNITINQFLNFTFLININISNRKNNLRYIC